MKHIYIVSSMCLLLLFSCSKGIKNEPEPDIKKIPITFNITGFTQTHVPTGIKNGRGKVLNDADTLPVTKLYYRLIKTTGQEVTAYISNKTNNSFGVINDSVPAGDYYVIFIGGHSNLKALYGSYFTNYIENDRYWNDSYQKSIPITVTNSPIALNVNMERVTSQLVLNIEDAIPTDVKKITISYNDNKYAELSTGNPRIESSKLQSGAEVTLKSSDKGKTGYQIVTHNMLRGTPVTVTLKYYKADPVNPYDTKVIENVVCQKNTRTILSGKLFTSKNTGFTVTVDPTWGTSNQEF